MTYDAGDQIQLTGTYRDANGALVDPASVTFDIRQPDAVLASYVYGVDSQLTRVSLGVYRLIWTISVKRPHRYSFAGGSSRTYGAFNVNTY